MKLIQSRDDL